MWCTCAEDAEIGFNEAMPAIESRCGESKLCVLHAALSLATSHVLEYQQELANRLSVVYQTCLPRGSPHQPCLSPRVPLEACQPVEFALVPAAIIKEGVGCGEGDLIESANSTGAGELPLAGSTKRARWLKWPHLERI